jgi:hypothetical protein
VSHQSSALEHFAVSVDLEPESACTFYHLALTQMAVGDAAAALLSARRGVELEPLDTRLWHLLGLVLTANGDWAGANTVLSLGIESAESGATSGTADGSIAPDDATITEEAAIAPAADETATITNAPSASSPLPTASAEERLVTASTGLPPSSQLILPQPDISPPSNEEKFEASVQLRLTQIAIVEVLEGSEGASVRWPELFSFFSNSSPSGPPTPSRRESFRPFPHHVN